MVFGSQLFDLSILNLKYICVSSSNSTCRRSKSIFIYNSSCTHHRHTYIHKDTTHSDTNWLDQKESGKYPATVQNMNRKFHHPFSFEWSMVEICTIISSLNQRKNFNSKFTSPASLNRARSCCILY